MSIVHTLTDCGMRAYEIAEALDVPVEVVEESLDERRRAEDRIEAKYEQERVRVQETIEEWLGEFPDEWKQEMRRRGLMNEIADARTAFQEACKEWALVKDKTFTHHATQHLQELEQRLWNLDGKAKVMVGAKEGISPEAVERARTYPITNLVKSVRGMALCPFHNEKTPSMDIRKNFYHCYGCGQTGDVIDFVRKLEGLTFPEAIRRLT